MAAPRRASSRVQKYVDGDLTRTAEIQIPFRFTPRSYQVSPFNDLQRGIKRIGMCWHRRSGKDKTCWNLLISEACRKVGTYFYVFPLLNQARKAIWQARGKDGIRFLDHIPPALIDGEPKDTEMLVKLWNGSIIQLLGSDNADAYRGTNPIGVVFSEFAFTDPKVWNMFRPILAENGGFAIFNSTPYGKNHYYDLKQKTENNPRWNWTTLTVDETFNEDGAPVVTQEMIEEDRLSGMEEEFLQQEYYCLDPNTKVLTADLTWVTLNSLATHPQDLIGIDEEAPQSGRRKLRRATILAVQESEKDCIKLEFADGTSAVASLEHPWLVRRKISDSPPYVWIEAKDLHIGDTIADIGLKPWEADHTYEGGYLSGIYDGEGCVSRRSVSFAQNPGPVLDACLQILEDKGLKTYRIDNPTVTIGANLHSSLEILGRLRPHRLLQKAQKVWEGVFPFNGSAPREIVAITPVGAQRVIGITTSTKTFIAEGLVTHNCSFTGSMVGSYYGRLVEEAERDGRIGVSTQYDPTLQVYTAWDIGTRDTTAIWFYQKKNRSIYFIDYFEDSGEGVEHYIKHLYQQKYTYAKNYTPHDIKKRDFALGKSALAVAETLTGKPNFFSVVPVMPIEVGLQAVRSVFPRCFFNSIKCRRGIDALKDYHKKWDAEKKLFSLSPDHSWSSHASDAFRIFATSFEEPLMSSGEISKRRPSRVGTSESDWMRR